VEGVYYTDHLLYARRLITVYLHILRVHTSCIVLIVGFVKIDGKEINR